MIVRRLVLSALLGVLGLCLVVASSPAPSVAMATIDATQSPTAQRIVFQAALDATPKGRTIDLGGQSVTVDRPVFLPDQVSLRNGTVRVPFGRHHPAIYLGIPRTPLGQALDPDRHWFDRPGGRHGLHMDGDAFVAASTLPLTQGMDRARQLTVEWAEDYALAPPDGQGRGILGCQDRSRAYPIYIVQDNTNKYVVAFRVHGDIQHAFTFQPPAGATVHDFALQINLATASVAVFIDRVQAPFAWWYHEGPFTPDDQFCDNDLVPFKLCGASGKANSPNSDYFDLKGHNLAIGGLRVSSGTRYTDGLVGSPQVRTDGRAITDQNTYFDVDSSTLGLLPLDDDPADSSKDRHVTILSPQGVGMGLYLSDSHATTYSSIGGNTFEDLTVQIDGGWMTPYGQAVVMGYEQEFTARRCRFYGGAVGLGSYRWGASYVTRLYECRFQGVMACLYNYYEIVEMYNCVIESHGRHSLWAVQGSIRAKDTWCSYVGSNNVRSFVRGDQGAYISIDHMDIDVEDENYDPEFVAAFDFVASNAPGNPDGGFARLRDVGVGVIPRSKPLIRLRGEGGSRPGVFVLEDSLFLGSPCSSLIDTDGHWAGTDAARSLRGLAFPRVIDRSPSGPPAPGVRPNAIRSDP